jgi:hypothetical protein
VSSALNRKVAAGETAGKGSSLIRRPARAGFAIQVALNWRSFV